MKKIALLTLVLMLPLMAQGQIVNNSGSTAADSIALPFFILDSAGNMTATTTNDSLFLIVFYPSGTEAFRDTVAHGNSLITTVSVANYSVYSWKCAVADIDGSGKDGLYSYIIFVKDVTGAALATPHKGYFQLYQAYDYNTWASRAIDSLQAVIDTLQLQDDWILRPTVAGRTLDVTTTGEAGLDFSNVAGTIDAAEIGTGVITNQKFAGGAIDAAAIATDAVGSAEIAAGAITSSEAPNLDAAVSSRSSLVTSDNISINWGDVTNPTSSVNLSNTFIGTVVDLADSAIDSASVKTNAFTSRQFMDNVYDASHFDGTFREEIWNTPFTSGAVAAGSLWDSLNNASYMQGAASGLDSGAVSRILGRKIFGIASGTGGDSTTLSQRKVTPWGGFTDSNKTEQGGIAGANRTWNVYVFDTSGTDTPIPSANVDVQLTNGTVKLRGTSNASGLTTFTVTDGSWVLVSQETGYVLNNLPKTISANSTDTVKGFDVQVGAPASPALCRVYGYVYSVGAIPDEGASISAFLPAGVARSGNVIVSPFSVSTTTDSLGYFYLDLIRSDSLIPVGTLYDFVINRKDGTIVHKRVTVPSFTSWLLTW